MVNFGLIAFCMLAGIVFKRLKLFPENAPVTLNRFIITLSLPALTLFHVHQMHLGTRILLPVAMPWLVFLVAAVIFPALARAFRWDVRTVGTLILVGGLGNTSFLGFPMLEALYGPQALETGILTDQPGSFLALSTLGIVTACLCSGTSVRARNLVGKLLRFPPFVALLLALLLRPVPFPEPLTFMLERLGGTLMPLALFSVGLQIRLEASAIHAERLPLALGIGYKMLLAPALIALLYAGVLGERGEAIQISILQASLAPMITAGIVASEYKLNTRLSALLLGIGIPLSLLTVPVWWWLIRGLG